MRRGDVALRLGATMASALVAAALLAPWLAPFDPLRAVTASFGEPLPPGAPHWFGTDELGRDVFSRILLGSRLSLLVAGAATTLAMGVGVTLGLLAGYGGRGIDGLLMRIGDVFLAFPSVLLAIAVATLFEPGLLGLFLVIGLVSWTPVARAVRGEVLSLRQRDYVRAGEALGAGAGRVMRRHLLPNAAPTILAMAALSASTAFLLDAGLSYLGLGVPVPAPSWGRMIGDSLSYFRVAPWLVAFPGLAIVYSVLAFNLIALGLLRRRPAESRA